MSRHVLMICILFSLLLASCQNLVINEPSFKIRKIAISPRSLSEMGILLHIDVYNPNPFDIKLCSFEYTVYLDKEEFGSGNLEQKLLVTETATTPLKVPVNVKFRNLWGGIKAVISSDNLPYKIEGKARVETSFGILNYVFSQEGRIPQKE